MNATDPIEWAFTMGRVRCRLIDECDRSLYVGLYAATEVMAHIGATMSVEAAVVTFEKALRYNRDPAARARYWRIVDARRGDAVAGMVALVRTARAPTRGELGIMLLPQWQNRGIGLPAVAGVVEGVMRAGWWPDIDLLIGRHSVANPNAGRITEALAFDRQPDDGSGQVSWWFDRANWSTRRDTWPAAAGEFRIFPREV